MCFMFIPINLLELPIAIIWWWTNTCKTQLPNWTRTHSKVWVLGRIAILDGTSIIFLPSCISLGQFPCHSKLLSHMCQASNILLFSLILKCFSVSSTSYPFMSFSFWVCWNFNNIFWATIRYLWFNHYHHFDNDKG